MAEYVIKTPLWTADKTLYRPGKRQVSDAHAKELGLLKSAGTAPEGDAGGEASKGAAVKYPYPELLSANGFKDWASVEAAPDADLLKIDGIGPTRLAEIRAWKPKA
jgi:hypothetical protein